MKTSIKYSLCAILIFLKPYLVFADYNIGTPFIESFSTENYKAGSKNWDMAQDARSIMYFANDEGLLEFDGFKWNIFPLPDKTIIRSVEVDQNGLIYAGGQNEFGRFIPNLNGKWQYESLKDSIPIPYRNFEDVWNLSVFKDGFIFRSAGKLYSYKNNKWFIDESLSINYLNHVSGEIFAQDNLGFLYWYKEKSWKKINGSAKLQGSTVTSLISLSSERFLVSTVENGIFEFKNNSISKWETELDDFFTNNYINCAQQLYDGSIAIGTYLSGLVIIDVNGQLKYHITKNDGLLNNNITSLYNDAGHNLWIGVDNGISLVKVNYPFLRVYPDMELEGSGYAIQVFNEKIYFGTSNGLYSKPWPENHEKISDLKKFTPIEGTSGQNWGLDIVNGELILSHHKGAFRIKNNKAFKALEETGVWLINKFENGVIVAGTYEGLKFYANQNNNLVEVPYRTDFKESSRFIEQDKQGNIWVSHPYRGVFRLTPKGDSLIVNHYGSKDGLSDLHNHLFKINNEIIVCGKTGVLIFDTSSNRFVPHQGFNKLFGTNEKIRRLFEAPNEDIWFVTENQVGLLNVTDRLLNKDITKIEFPELRSLLNNGFELIYPLDDEHVFFTARQGFIHYLPKKELALDSTFKILLNEVRVNGKRDSVIFSGIFTKNESISVYQPTEIEQRFKHRIKGIQFTFTAIDYMNNSDLLFRYQLIGYDNKWSEWTNKRTKEYTNLSAGQYSFKIQASKLNGELTPTFAYNFVIKSNWYASNIAKIIYVFLFVLITITAYKLTHTKIKTVKEEADQSIKQKKLEIDRLEKQNIDSQLEHKNRELISSALHISRKNEILTQITDELNKIEKECGDDHAVNQIKKLKSLLRNEEVVEEGWENHMLHFNQLNGSYTDELKKKYPSLTPKDIKLCTYLKMNLTTKEIASIMNVSIRAVEASRYRLRKKMDLSSDDNLTEVLMNFG